MTSLVGHTIGQYRILEEVGRGGMATVYKAFQPSMERNVAIKILPAKLAQTTTYVERFKQEVKSIAQLEHPHILPVYDFGEHDGLTYMVMRFMNNGTLTDRLRDRISVAQLVRQLGDVAEALHYTHSRGIVHRDIKPSNILIDARGEALLTDFGIAKVTESVQSLTGAGIVGTPKYMSPEQAQGQAVDGRSDIYSLGIILYEGLVGRLPFEAETPVAVLMKHVNEPLPLPRKINPNISEEMERVILKALAKDPADRYQTGNEMNRAMAVALAQSGQGETQYSVVADPPLSPTVATIETTTPVAVDESTQPKTQRPLYTGVVIALCVLGLVIASAVGYFGFGVWQTPAAEPIQLISAEGGDDHSTPTAAAELESAPPSNDSTATSESTPTNASSPTPSPQPATSTPAPTATPLAAATLPPPPTSTPAPTLTPTAAPLTLSGITNVSNTTDFLSNYVNLKLDDQGFVHITWLDNYLGKIGQDIVHRALAPDGTWSDLQNLTDGLFKSVISSSTSFARGSTGEVCLFFAAQGLNENAQQLYSRCFNGNTTTDLTLVQPEWREAIPAFNPSGQAVSPHMVSAGTLRFGNVEIVNGNANVANLPTFAIDTNGTYHAVWVRQTNPFRLEHSFSADGGRTWSEIEKLTAPDDPLPSWPQLDAGLDGEVHLAWSGFGGRNFHRVWQAEVGWSETVEVGPQTQGSAWFDQAIDANGRAQSRVDVGRCLLCNAKRG